MKRNYSKFRIQKIKLVQKRCSSNLRIHFTLTPTHMGTKHKLQLLVTQTKLFFYTLSSFYDFLIKNSH